MRLKFKKIRLDGGTQPREEINEIVVGDYRDDMRNGAVFPPITVFYDGTDYWLADGFHRYRAALDLYDGHETKDDTIEAEVRQGSRRDAILFAVGANATHGERRTSTDKRRAVETLLRDKEWSQWSNYKIAKQCAVSEGTVRNIRESLTTKFTQLEPAKRTYINKHGQQAIMNTANIGKFTPEEIEAGRAARAEEEVYAAEAWQALRDLFRAWQDTYALRLRNLHMGREVIDKSRKIESILALKPLYADAERWQKPVVIDGEGSEDAA